MVTVLAAILLFAAALGPSGSSDAQPPSQSAAPTRPPDALLTALGDLNSELATLIEKEQKGHGLGKHVLMFEIEKIADDKHRLVGDFFDQDVYGVKLSVVVDRFDCASSALAAVQHVDTKRERRELLKTAARCKEKLEKEFSQSPETPAALRDGLARADGQIQDLERDVRAGHAVNVLNRVGAIRNALRALVRATLTQVLYGERRSSVRASDVVTLVDVIDESLTRARYDRDQRLILDWLRTAGSYLQPLERLLEHAVPPVLTPIHAVFTSSTVAGCSPPACTTVYTEKAQLRDMPFSEGLRFQWAVAIPADPDCARGFQPNTPHQADATWYHADASEGGTCNHSGTAYDASGSGHPAAVTVTVSNDFWSCVATFSGTQGPQAQPIWDGPAPQPCQAK